MSDIILKIIYVIFAILVFEVLVLIHEWGHYHFAKLFKVKIREFSVGMGPRIAYRRSKKTGVLFSLRLLPIGGFVDMVGEDGESDHRNAFWRKPVWQRMIITAAGAAVNIFAGFVAMMILVACSGGIGGTTVGEFVPRESFEAQGYEYYSSEEAGLALYDTILEVNGDRVHVLEELQYELAHSGDKPLTLTVERDGEIVTIENVCVPRVVEQGVTFGSRDFFVLREEKSIPNVIKHGFYRSISTVKMIWESLIDLVSGRYGIKAVSGPVGVTRTLATAASSSPEQFIYIAIVISINLGIMNLLPFPALDGGRLLFLFIELIFRRPFPRKVEGYIHFAGIVLLLALMAFITLKDIIGLF